MLPGPDEGTGYRLTVVDIEVGRAATIGDILEISAHSTNPSIGVQPLRYTVTAEDVKRSLIQLPELAAYEIPAETQLLANYPNPFNPETWIPYRLAEDAFVTLTIYDLDEVGSSEHLRWGIGWLLSMRVGRRRSTGMAEIRSVSRWQAVSTSITCPLAIIPIRAKWSFSNSTTKLARETEFF